MAQEEAVSGDEPVKLCLLSIWLFTSALLSAPALANLYYDVAARYGLDPVLVQAIAKVESDGHPWVMNVDGNPLKFASKDNLLGYYHYVQQHPWLVRTFRSGRWRLYWFATPGEARRYLAVSQAEDRQLGIRLKAYRSVVHLVRADNTDFGVMQVNWSWHGRAAGVSLSRLVDPSFNLDYACRYLASLISQYGTWEGIARYHSTRRDEQRKYQLQIWRAYKQLRASTLRNLRLAQNGATYSAASQH